MGVMNRPLSPTCRETLEQMIMVVEELYHYYFASLLFSPMLIWVIN